MLRASHAGGCTANPTSGHGDGSDKGVRYLVGNPLEPELRWLPEVGKMIGSNPGRMLLVSTVALLFLRPPVARATVYSWKGEGGVLMLSNDPSDVPEDQQSSAQKFTAKPAPRPVPDEEATPPPSARAAEIDTYQRGFDAGMQAAERQVALAEELARTVLAAVPQTPPAPIVIVQSAPPITPDVAYDYPPPYYGLAGPYAPYPFPYGFAVSFVPHRHFFPGAGGRRFAPFFPHGQFSRAWTGRMR